MDALDKMTHEEAIAALREIRDVTRETDRTADEGWWEPSDVYDALRNLRDVIYRRVWPEFWTGEKQE